MCELLGMSVVCPTDLDLSLELFRPHGGESGPHADGWGIAFYEGHTARLYKEARPACESEYLAFLQGYGLKSQTAIAHIRRANPPDSDKVFANTHPFERELAGRSWVFAHNGVLPGIRNIPLTRFSPIGTSDSEYAFCLLLEAVATQMNAGRDDPDTEQIMRAVNAVTNELNELDEFNYLLSDGELLIAHAHTELHLLQRTCSQPGCNQRVILVATQPLTNEPWSCLVPNTMLVLHRGRIVHQATTEGLASPAAWKRRRELRTHFQGMGAQAKPAARVTHDTSHAGL